MSRGSRVTSDVGLFAMLPEWILDAEVNGKPISDRAVRLFAVLARSADYETGQATVYRSTLASRLNCSKDSVDRAKDELMEIGALEVVTRKLPGSVENAANLYLLRYAMPEDVALEVAARTRPLVGTGADEVAAPTRPGGRTGAAENENLPEREEGPNDLLTKKCERCHGSRWVPDFTLGSNDVLPCPDCADADPNDPRYHEPEPATSATAFIADAKAKQRGGLRPVESIPPESRVSA